MRVDALRERSRLLVGAYPRAYLLRRPLVPVLPCGGAGFFSAHGLSIPARSSNSAAHILSARRSTSRTLALAHS